PLATRWPRSIFVLTTRPATFAARSVSRSPRSVPVSRRVRGASITVTGSVTTATGGGGGGGAASVFFLQPELTAASASEAVTMNAVKRVDEDERGSVMAGMVSAGSRVRGGRGDGCRSSRGDRVGFGWRWDREVFGWNVG